MTTFTTTSRTSKGALPQGFTQVGGIVLDLVGANGVRVVSQLAASSLYVGYAQSNPQQIGVQSGFTPALLASLGGGLSEVAIRITLYDGDSGPGEFDDGRNALLLDGTAIENFSAVVTEATDGDGNVSFSSGTGFYHETLSTGWFYTNSASALAAIFASLQDGNLAFQLSDGTPADNFYDFTRGVSSSNVNVGQPPNSPSTAADDANSTTESTPATGNVTSNDSDAEGDAFSVTEVNGDSTKVDQQFTLASGALLTVNADGTYSYNPNGAFNYLVSPTTAAATGAKNGSATDTVTYTISGGDTATVTITITGEDDAGDRLLGDSGDNAMTGTADRDIFDLRQGGADDISGQGGRDVFYFGGAFGPGDELDGGGNSDIVILQGDYSAPTSLAGITNLGNLGSISLFSHTNTLYGGQDGTPNSYNLVASDENVGAGEILKINGSSLAAGENLTFDGGAETDGTFWIYGGMGTDRLTGGAANDVFIFAHDGRFVAGDRVEGGAGYDLVALRGDYTLNLLDPAFAGAFSGIESIALLSASETTYSSGGDGEFDFVILWGDSHLGAGATITVNGSRLGANETMYFDGGNETDGHFRLWGGSADDFIAGGAGNDLLYGGLGEDDLIGGGGADTFRYQSTAESTAAATDTITGFQAGVDKIDLSRIDANVHAAGDQAFRWVGLGAFTGQGAGSAGELRAVATGAGQWTIQGDTDGDGVADLVIQLNATPIITFGDFIP